MKHWSNIKNQGVWSLTVFVPEETAESFCFIKNKKFWKQWPYITGRDCENIQWKLEYLDGSCWFMLHWNCWSYDWTDTYYSFDHSITGLNIWKKNLIGVHEAHGEIRQYNKIKNEKREYATSVILSRFEQITQTKKESMIQTLS